MQTMPTITSDIFIVQGTTYSATYKVTDVEAYSFYACIRKHQDDDAFVEFNIEIDALADTVTFSLDPSSTSALYPKTYLYQFLMKDLMTDVVSALAQGNAIVDPGVVFVDPGVSDGEIIIDGGSF